MIRSELVQLIADRKPSLCRRDVENTVNAILAEIAAALVRGDRVELRGFGVFSTKQRQARTGRNPRTRELVQVDKRRLPVFKASKEMHERLNHDARTGDVTFQYRAV
ncbi:integration host factor subunit beta [Bradyrhizobium sp. CCGUVB1N3]|uniref:integration host factor subunit beta n=1 Tax=Bradyrhizobium sp. CCGUVB1N3 TaxID=2949629 RepID=UPI0020B44C5C|nr:integration host factor subunit beta [Bradyrhizobium sp. CCGUVB1N3]MCP3475702.1 integration host factor subunit beta [Bradyrhizobium sp. CCGUVB1N3]